MKIHWITLDPGLEPAPYARKITGADIVLGGSPASYQVGGESGSEDVKNVLVINMDLISPIGSPNPVANDPRRDRSALGSAERRLKRLGWTRGFGELVEDFARERAIGESPNTDRYQTNISENEFPRTAGVAVAQGAPNRPTAARFLKFLGESYSTRTTENDDTLDSWLADLIGSTLIDAGDEARRGRRSSEQAGRSIG